MNCVNLLAAIQIAVAFDFGLLLITGDKHILTDIHATITKNIYKKFNLIVSSAKVSLSSVEHSKDINIKACRSKLSSSKRELEELLEPNRNRWGKYSFLGLFSGIYGILCLIFIGMTGGEWDSTIKNFLIMTTEIILFTEVMFLLTEKYLQEDYIPRILVYLTIILMPIILIITLFMAILKFFIPFWPQFEIPFSIGSIIIVYMPILVYIYRFIDRLDKIQNCAVECNNNIQDLEKMKDEKLTKL